MKKVPYQTAVVDGVKVRYQYGGRDGAPVILFFNGLEMQEMWMPYAERLGQKYRFLIYEYRCVYMLKDYPVIEERDFEYLRGKIQILLPEKDIFKKEDQDRLADLFQKLDAEILSAPGGHAGFIVQAEHYIDLMGKFLTKNGI